MNNWLTATVLTGAAVLGAVEAERPGTAEKDLRQRITEFRDAGDARDLKAIERVLHKDFRLVAYMGDAVDAMLIDKAGYTGALAAGKMGGVHRELSIISVDIRGDQATCRLRMQSSALKFENAMQWVKTSEGWQLLNDLTHAVPAK